MMLQRRIFYIADMHFGHKNILKYDKRPFADTGQMDEVMTPCMSSATRFLRARKEALKSCSA